MPAGGAKAALAPRGCVEVVDLLPCGAGDGGEDELGDAVATGLSVAIPEGYEIQVRPRSGLALKHGISVPNAPGTIDSDYRGELKVILINHGAQDFAIARGDRIAQLVLAPVTRAAWDEVEDLDATARGEGGFGSTGGHDRL